MYRAIIADDEAAERDGIAFLLQQGGYPVDVQKCANGLAALAALKDERADLLITDVKMPFLDGLELCEQAKRLDPDILLLISSAYGDFEYMQKAIQVKVDAYILKPVIVPDFHTILERSIALLDHRAALQEKRRRLLEEYKEANYYQREKLLQTLLQDDPEADAGAPAEVAERAVISKSIALIEQNYQQDIGLEWIARQIYLSPGYLSGLFKKETGKNIIQYLTIYRMERAKELLTRTNMKIVDIAQAVGYNNTSYFCLLFRKCYGVTANQMRDQETTK